MVPPVRWYHLLSSWIFYLSVAYPLHGIPTFPLNLLASVGCFETVINPHKESVVKNIYILFIHLAPFLWIPYEISRKTLSFALIVAFIYVIFIGFIGENVGHVYSVLLNENHKTAAEFWCDRYGFC
jgi:hypothetical protein